MNWYKMSVAGLAIFAAAACGDSGGETTEKKDWKAEVLVAVDQRDVANPVFEEALNANQPEVLAFMGHMGEEMCGKIAPYLVSDDKNYRYYAAIGAAYCQDEKLSANLLSAFDAEEDVRIKEVLAVALGYSGGEVARMPLFDNYAELDEAGLVAIIQSIAYAQVKASDYQLAPFGELLDLTSDKKLGYAAAYALGRVNGLNSMLELADVERAISEAPSVDVKIALTRVARQFGNEAAPLLLSLIEGQAKVVRIAAITAMARLSDEATKLALYNLVEDESAHVRHAALAALANRNMDDPGVEAILDNALSNGTSWDKVSAMRGIRARDAELANRVASEWLAGDDYYLAFQGLIILSGSDEGREILKEYADTHKDTVRGYEAAVALDPSIEADTVPRATPDFATTQNYVTKTLTLSTTQGDIIIKMRPNAPFAATSFLQAAEQGKLDGMLWHRVIPNFVAQAGQKEDPELYKWGSIREEWGGAHEIGTVGVATAGPDTGTTQFFINTAYNMHLNGRYTVFGEVTSSMNVVYNLQEGDKIIKATVSR
ncbi:peptidylprolyl isomerase [Kordiimonas laminariae]|uniref:peptidylprolyl isomerase n=1 Tax=Kordiimonas laminariae TaxID=2917717 RepID=UPI001FF32786|nr:peptidylprolyl isomerase [Kordiimonas laminariae]MCK0067901.1 peptidylprolyl isomerase [Kordiimonas laminariae]